MIEIRPFAELGQAEFGWLKARHHFSFGHYSDAERMGWGRIRVWNDDEIAPGTGFDPHPHRDMEIVTFVREGAISHRDNLGNQGRTEAGDVQVMSAGSGIVHAEYNLEPVTTSLFQIWIRPDRLGLPPAWGSRRFPRGTGEGFTLLASGREGDAASGALPLNADAAVLAATLAPGEAATLAIAAGRVGYLVVAKGAAGLNGQALGLRDAAAIAGAEELRLTAGGEGAELVFVETKE
ncbi:pirin family protein [Roseomonas sp. GC11]|uniref:pirin family protein n=1 Tax=Roseomonas sp. GC11 TaxID=2950546 RepID=UPI00210DA88E|nr:pirin-like bicupin family protein [Roseomonas sp. GC11]MCQ4158862.1 pirin family protein [Roseomonas sp. GC11]